MDIQDTRRANLAKWLDTHSVPQKEKSLFSQLKGTGSFGERVARRLERQYAMGDGFLDRAVSAEPPIRGQKHPLSSEAKKLVQWVERIDGLGDPARNIFSHLSVILDLAESLGKKHNPSAVHALISEEEDLERIVRPSERAGGTHASRERRSKK